MSAKTVDDSDQQSTQIDSTSQQGEFSDLIWDRKGPAAPTELLFSVEQLYANLRDGYLNRDEWLTCVHAAALTLDPSHKQSIKAQLTALCLSASGCKPLSNKQRENFIEAWVHAAEARRAVAEGLGDAAQAHLDGAYTLLAANMKSRAHRKMIDNKTKGRQECIEEFAKVVRVERPVSGWTDHSAVAKALDQKLAIIIHKKKSQYGPLWNRDPAALIIEWLAKGKGSVHEAYRGRG